jgi:hypothetical protein
MEGLLKDFGNKLIVNDTTQNIERFLSVVTKRNDSRIVLLRRKEVIQWLYGETSFLNEKLKEPLPNTKVRAELVLKNEEDKWGRLVLKERRPDLKLDKQWTNKFGEHICEELYMLLGENVRKPVKHDNYQPDLEIDDVILEAKAETYFTNGTASEKILGCPFKYADVPELYSKELRIICMGGAEKVCRVQYGNLESAKMTAQKRKFIEFYEENRIKFVGASDLMNKIVDKS